MTLGMEPEPSVEEPPEGHPAPEEDRDEALESRRYPSTLGGMFYIGLLGLAIAGVVVAAYGHWRVGVQMLAAAVVCAGLLRAFLNEIDAGMLAVRNRWFDVSLLLATGAVLWFLAATIPSAS